MIIFKRITFANFLSAGNTPVTIDLNKTKTTLIHGTNGSGKSTVLDAICYALYNKPFRKVSLPQLINTQNKKGLLTEIEFSIGGTDYTVLRGRKPNIFKIFKNGEEIQSKAADRDNQAHLESNILKLSYKSFCQVCILGSANYIPFMQLPTAARRECIEDFLDIKVFSAMALLAKERLRGLKDDLNHIKGELGNYEFKIGVQNDRIQEIEARSKADTQEYEVSLSEARETFKEKQALVERLATHHRSVSQHRDTIFRADPKGKLLEYTKIHAKLEQKLERIAKEVEFYNSNSECPTCNQPLANKIKDKNLKDLASQTEKLEVAKQDLFDKICDVEVKVRILNRRDKYLSHILQSLRVYESEMNSAEATIRNITRKLKELKDDTSSIDKEQGKLEILQESFNDLGKRRDARVVDVNEHEIVVNLLKDSGIKTSVVRKYLPVMNKVIRQYLTDLDLPIHFKLDEEFNETVSSPLHQDFSYASFSEGQKARIDLSLMFTWREVGKLKNSVSTNLLILDEVFSSSLDDVGKELLLAMIRYKLPDNNNIIVVDHTLSGEFKSKFENTVEVSRIKGFSQYD